MNLSLSDNIIEAVILMDFEDVRLSDGRTYKIERIEVSTRTATASVRGDRIIIKILRMLRGSEASGMFQNLKGRIVKSLEEHPERFERTRPSFSDGQRLELFGKNFSVSIGESEGSRSYGRVENEMLIMKITREIETQSRGELVFRLATKTLSNALLPELMAHVDEINMAHFGSEIRNVRIRDNSTRWGSYSKKSRSITINFRLFYAPREILDYVIFHELSHSIVPNHSARFWSLMDEKLPDYKERKRWLRKNGELLGRTGRQAS